MVKLEHLGRGVSTAAGVLGTLGVAYLICHKPPARFDPPFAPGMRPVDCFTQVFSETTAVTCTDAAAPDTTIGFQVATDRFNNGGWFAPAEDVADGSRQWLKLGSELGIGLALEWYIGEKAIKVCAQIPRPLRVVPDPLLELHQVYAAGIGRVPIMPYGDDHPYDPGFRY